MHRNAEPAARAAMAAYQQGKFWEFHDKLFANQSTLSPENYLKYAKELKLDMGRFNRDISELSTATIKQINADKAEANALGITGTPTFFINGRYLSGARPFEDFAKMIDAELAPAKLPIPKLNPATIK